MVRKDSKVKKKKNNKKNLIEPTVSAQSIQEINFDAVDRLYFYMPFKSFYLFSTCVFIRCTIFLYIYCMYSFIFGLKKSTEQLDVRRLNRLKQASK